MAEVDQAVALVAPHSPRRTTPKVPCSRDSADQVLIVHYLFLFLLLQAAISCVLGNLLSLQLSSIGHFSRLIFTITAVFSSGY